jgi:hypothetical protein
VLQELTDYLIRNHKVIIPGMGCFELHRHPAHLDFAERLLHPPYYSIQFSRNDVPDERQAAYFPNASLQEFGQQLKRASEKGEVNWAGIGILRTTHGTLTFQPNFNNNLLAPIEAHKVIRKEEEHEVTRGEQVFTSTELRNEKPFVRRRKYALLVAGIVGLLAVAFVIYYFSAHGWQPLAAGNQQEIELGSGK